MIIALLIGIVVLIVLIMKTKVHPFLGLIIAAVTFVICMGGLAIGKQFGTKLSSKASILGGVILILIGLEIFITGVF